MPKMKIATFDERINELLDSVSGTDSEIGRKLGVSRQTISAWKNGSRSPRTPMIEHIASTLKVSVEWLMGFDTPMKSVGNNICDLRSKIKLSDSQLAELLHISLEQYRRYEAGRAVPPSDIIDRLADIFDVDKFEIIGWNEFDLDPAETEKSPAPNSAELTDPNEDHLISNYRSLDSQKQNSLIDYSDYLKNQM